MKKIVRVNIIMLLLFLWAGAAFGQGPLRYADVGDYSLESGQVIRDCRIAYRTFGVLNASRSNAIMFPTWFAGTTQELVALGLIGPGKMADSSRYYVIAVEAFGNGVSSSPSNSKQQPGHMFPRFSIRDMVNAQHMLATRYLNLPRLRAVMGISMGAMITYQWMVSYPDFLDKAVAIVGSPRLTSYDLLLWQAELSAIDPGESNPERKSTAMKTLAAIHNLHLRTPHYISTNTAPENMPEFLAAAEEGMMKYDASNWAWQLKAIMGHDIYKTFGNSAEGSAKAVHAKTFIIWSQQDLMVNPEPAQAYAKLLHADTLALTGDCGHLAFLCEGEVLREKVRNFLDY
jgi:homoserine O-acetyltransferase/O-succinyltransferase